MLIHLVLYLAVLVVAGAALTEVQQLEQKVEQLQESIEQLIQQVRQQQLYVEERTRSEGVSGIKQARVVTQGTKPYFATVQQVASIHEHVNGYAAAGLGEFVAVLNGVEFRTRHNDYPLVQPDEMRGNVSHIEYNKVRPITYPEVPPEVTNKTTEDEQMEEMREWFKAWRDQNHKVRDYRKYFKPILCYLEGGWTFADGDTMEEPFYSARHHVDAKSWKELEDKILFTSSSGKKDSQENLAYLPTSYFNTDNGTSLGQWNYRILCHPLKNDLPLNQLEVIDDLASRMSFGYTLEQHEQTRAARYSLTEYEKDRFTHFTLLDKLMGEIPGKDGYGNELTDRTLEGDMINDYLTQKPQKAGYYNRMFKSKKDAMQSDAQYRTFSGETTFMALTTQDKIVPTGYETCEGEGENQTCSTFRQRWTYAIPLEIIYMTPIHTWNPYDIEYKGDAESDYGATARRRVRKTWNGKSTKAFNGTNSELNFRTPSEFFDKGSSLNGFGDTGYSIQHVLDRSGNIRQTVGSGIRIHLPEIKDLGKLRTRYPIMPFYHEGSAAWKELAALRDMIMDSEAQSIMFNNKLNPTPEDTTTKRMPDLGSPDNTTKPMPDLASPDNTTKPMPDLATLYNTTQRMSDLALPDNTTQRMCNLTSPDNTTEPMPDLTSPDNTTQRMCNFASTDNTTEPMPDLASPDNPAKQMPDLASPDNPAKQMPDLASPDNPAKQMPDLASADNTIKQMPDLASPDNNSQRMRPQRQNTVTIMFVCLFCFYGFY